LVVNGCVGNNNNDVCEGKNALKKCQGNWVK
jgi:hypothetical protein